MRYPIQAISPNYLTYVTRKDARQINYKIYDAITKLRQSRSFSRRAKIRHTIREDVAEMLMVSVQTKLDRLKVLSARYYKAAKRLKRARAKYRRDYYARTGK